MLLYHGSNLEIKKPELQYSRDSLDFGSGFYTTTDWEQAEKWARRVTKIRGQGEAVVNVYDVDQERWGHLTVKHFERADSDWLHTVVSFRIGQMSEMDYDVIGGPVANDRTIDVINQYIAGSFSAEIALQLLLPMHFKDQWVLKTEKAIATLKYREAIRL